MEVRMTRWTQLMIAGAAALAVACGSDGSTPLEKIASATKTGGGDSSGTTNNGNNGNNSGTNTVGLVITPANLTLAVGWYGHLAVANRDANGTLTPKRATLTSSNPAVVAVFGDTGVVQGKSVGIATITATVDGATAAATVVVTAAPPPPAPIPPPLAEFSMKVVALGRIPAADTTKAERIAGATVKLLRVGGVTGDTLKTPIDAGNAVTNANGEVSFSKLAGGSYEVRIAPPASSGYQAGFVGFGPPRMDNFTINVSLVKP
jgi:hypothetical protein